MKILFIAKGDFPDFQSDMVFHGGRLTYGDDFVDANKLWYMYKEDKQLYWNTRIPNNGKDRGRGFTLYGKFDQGLVNRDDIANKICSHFYDKIIYGSVTRCFDYIDIVRQHYDKKDVLFIDGEDDQLIRLQLCDIGQYYKRELLTNNLDKARPIHFAIPKDIIINAVPNKTKEYATLIPGDSSTYIYDTESDYFKGYQEAYLGITYKKGGWDCLRHYEILLNGCIPYFPGISDCPQHTMISFPKQIVEQCNNLLTHGLLTDEDCVSYITHLLRYTRINLTTERLFNNIMKSDINSRELKNTYIFVCNYNRLTPLKDLINSLKRRGYNNIVVLDNGSTYQPLLDWYQGEGVEVYFCKHNYGPEALDMVRNYEPEFQQKYNHIILNEYHVYTDSDVIPVDEASDDFIDNMIDLCKKYNIPKLGLSLKIDDLPDHNILKNKIIGHESSFFQREYIDDVVCRLYKAPVDTTFAVNSPGMACGYSDHAYRAGDSYFGKHYPWYYDSNNLPEDEQYYLTQITGTRPHWSNLLKESISNVNSNT